MPSPSAPAPRARPRLSAPAPRASPVLIALVLLLAACAAEQPAGDGSARSAGTDEGPASRRETAAPFHSEPRLRSDEHERFPGVVLPALAGELPEPGSLAGPVWLIGLDGVTWRVLEPMIAAGRLPHFAALLEEGAHGVLLSEEPMLSPALWTTIATGVPRQVHGVRSFTTKPPGRSDFVPVGPRDRWAPALWELVAAAGGESVVVGWFGSRPAEPIAGAYVSRRVDLEAPAPDEVHPPRLAAALAERATPRLPAGLAARVAGRSSLESALREDAATLAALRVALEEVETPAFVATYLRGSDVVQHLEWPEDESVFGDPERPSLVAAWHEHVDDALGELASLAPESATLVIVSDHGAGPARPDQQVHLHVDALLRSTGYTVPDATGEIDWSETTAYTTGEGQPRVMPIWLNLAGVEPEGIVPVEAAPSVARHVADRLGRLALPDERPLFRRIDVLAGEPDWRPGRPALLVELQPDAALAPHVLDEGEPRELEPLLRRVPNPGDHRLEGILIMKGPAVRPGRLEQPATLYHVAPTILWLLGLPQDARMLSVAPEDGGVLRAALKDEWLERHPPRAVERDPRLERRSRVWQVRDAEDGGSRETLDPAELERLRALGYVQ